jgi:peptidoglycan/LPS O-acetylase OafA/YrhL
MNRLRQLDGLRGCAIILVLLWHYVFCQLNPPAGTFLHMAKSWLSFAWSGVDLFFVLSGFLITGILLDNAKATNYFRTFYIRRACRILPIYLLLLLVFITSAWAFNDQAGRFPWLFSKEIPLWAYATFTQNIVMGLKNTWGPALALGPTWSLAVEEQFYLVLPLMIYFAPRRILPWLFVGLIVLAPSLRATAENFLQLYVQAPYRADSLISGALLAWCVRQPAVLQFFVAQRRRLYLIFGGLCAAAIISSQRAVPSLALDYLIFAALYACLLLLVYIDSGGLLGRLLQSRVLVWFGTLSYGIYLFHQPVSAGLHAWIHGKPPLIGSVGDALITCLALAVTLLLAACSFRLIERRFIEFGHRFSYGTEPTESPVLQPVPQPAGK